MKIPIVRSILYWDLAATEVLNDDKLGGSDPDYTAGVLLAKDLNGNIYILDSYEFQLDSRNLINEILNTEHVTSQMSSILNSMEVLVKTLDY